MHIRPLRPLRPVICGWVALLFAAAFAIPDAAHGHIEVETSSPDRDEVLFAPPPHIRILFSGRIEARYTSLTLTAPDGSEVRIGDVVFIGDSDREITALLPALERTGSYTVRWRTAGADGHVLEGSFVFVLASDSARAAPSESSDTMASAGAEQRAAAHDDHAEHDAPRTVGGAADSIGRGLHFGALLLLLGAVSFRALLMPRLALTDVTRAVLQRRTWRMAAAAALLLGAAAVVRLWFQSAALHGAERAWNTQLLSIMLTDTGWGRAWMLQAFLFALLGMAIVWARPQRDRAALFAAVAAVLGLSAIPGLSGHAAAANGVLSLAVVSDAVHVAAAGAWLGT
ncbi:MAG: copper resistance protein CopC, partial [Longimicrobiales bacterium]